MAKKTKKKGGQPKAPFRKVWWVVLVALVAIVVYEYYRKDLFNYIERFIERIELLASVDSSALYGLENLEIPQLEGEVDEQILRHNHYTVSYNSHWKVPNWVAYELTIDETRSLVERTDRFVADPLLGSANNLNSDYAKSGYDRGHMAPAADMAFDKRAMQESFYFSNMSPQHPSLNRGVWKELEDCVRDWAIRDSAVYVVSGNVVAKHPKTIGKKGVAVPSYIYKAVLSPYVASPQAIAFLFKNEAASGEPYEYAISVDSLERFVGIDLFPALPDANESVIESTYSVGAWSW